MNTPFGIIYGSNITPAPETGIGRWSVEAFERAMHEGISRDGSHLFPAFPYNAYTKLWDDDVKALYAYLMTRPPVSATVPRNTVWFPLNIRSLQEGWKILLFKSGRYQPSPAKSAEWNRGAYLAEGLAADSSSGAAPEFLNAGNKREQPDGEKQCHNRHLRMLVRYSATESRSSEVRIRHFRCETHTMRRLRNHAPSSAKAQGSRLTAQPIDCSAIIYARSTSDPLHKAAGV